MKSVQMTQSGTTFAGLVVMAFASSLLTQTAPKPAVPLEPISAILDAFKTHQIVALGEGTHGNEQGHAFRLALIRDPRFAATVNDIVVEFGSARYQDVIDRFTRGEDVSLDTLRAVWQDTTAANAAWDRPIYEEFFRTVRSVNASLPRERQLRVLLGDPPVDWASVHNADDLREWNDRDGHAAGVVQREVLAKGRRALIVYGDMHFLRKWPFPTTENNFRSLVTLLEAASATKVFSIWTHTLGTDVSAFQTDVSAWPRPSLTVLDGTVLGNVDFRFFYPGATVDGRPVAPSPGLHIQDEFDALLYLGPLSSITISNMPPALCNDDAYMEVRTQRMALVGMDMGQLRQYCASVATK
jgi:hypothetical protein